MTLWKELQIGLFSDRDPNNAFGYGVIDCDSLVKELLNPDITTTTVAC
jgi:hypothetical protein